MGKICSNDNQDDQKSLSVRRSYSICILLFLINVLNFTDRYTVAANLKTIETYYAINDTWGGLLQTVFIGIFLLCCPVCGYLGDRYSRKLIMLVGIILWIAMVLASTMVDQNHFWAFMLCRAVVGIGEASYSAVAPSIIADCFTKHTRSRMLMLFYLAMPVGSGLGFVIGGSVAEALGSWQWGLRVTPLAAIVLVVAMIIIVVDPPRGFAEKLVHQNTNSFYEDVKQILQIKSFVFCSLAQICTAFTTGASGWWVATYITYAFAANNINVSQTTISSAFGAVNIFGGLSGMLAGVLLAQLWRRYTPRGDTFVCATAMILSGPLTFIALNFADKFPVTFVIFYFSATAQCTTWGVTYDILMYIVTPTQRATATALQYVLLHLFGDGSSPYIIGQISTVLLNGASSSFDRYKSLQLAMLISPFVSVVGGFFYLVASWFLLEDKRKAGGTKLSSGTQHFNSIGTENGYSNFQVDGHWVTKL